MKHLTIILLSLLLLCSVVMAELPNPKLAGEIRLIPANPKIGQTISFEVRFKLRFAPVQNLKILAKIDNKNLWFTRYDTLAPPQDYYVECKWTATAGGHKISFEVDPDNLIQEYDETDNYKEKSFYIARELAEVTAVPLPSKITKDPSKIDPKTLRPIPLNLKLEPEIKKELKIVGPLKVWKIYGSVISEFNNVPEVWVSIRVSSAGFIHYKKVLVSNLLAGQAKIAATAVQAPAGDYAVIITVDPDNLLKEENRTDNTLMGSVHLTSI